MDISSNIRIDVTLAINKETFFHTQCLSRFISFHCAKFYMPSSNNSLVTAIKLKDRDNFVIAAMLLFDILWNYHLSRSSCLSSIILRPYRKRR